MKNSWFKSLVLSAVVLSSASHAVEKMSDTEVQKAQEQLQTTFTELTIKQFKPSPIPGLFEVYAGNNILYFHPDSETIFFGKIYNKLGESLTDKASQEFAMQQMKDLPMDSGIIIGDPNGVEVIEIGQMDCGFCKTADEYFTKLAKTTPVKRRYFFLDVPENYYPTARKKAEHIICSDDPSKAFEDVHFDRVKEYKTCSKAAGVIAQHQIVAEALGVSGTPTFVIDREIVPGFSQTQANKIESFVKAKLSTTSVN
ncbi:TPA: thioredoxin fold domain-containing protein [Vibrio cholerae]|nr:thioredoxin fold domain-containing protein [Vibrio cholerae]